MKISLEAVLSRYHIRSYSDGFIVIQTPENQIQQVSFPLFITPDILITGRDVPELGKFDSEQSRILQTLQLEVLLVVDDSLDFRQKTDFNRSLAAIAISAEWMTLGPACRTFNLLLQDQRKVALLVNSHK
ncbi:hypothetical protein MPL1_04527 [Methylophaga lonarensis MPL]|uniref:Uncharacterized protein n=1 Tax=Methylophaga lonarensis MPL TaxID=1286106 RepID=M7PI30_9GAMM|nr:hypothetical protein [Methylophaga lonarensis]EMR13555.1 hypothetical protein MPL1_04527 [Methylophaga lonarensis MPL]